MSKKYIGVFDSGFGGLGILKGIIKILPEYDYIYLGDTARAPYGNRSQEIIYRFTREAVEFLFKNDCELVILACNTASSEALARLQQDFLISYNKKYKTQKNILGVLVPTAEEAVSKTNSEKIGLLATNSVVRSQAFEREIQKLNPKINVLSVACPLLVPIIEEGEERNKILNLILEKYLRELKLKDRARNLDTLILGCTHYGLIERPIKKSLKQFFNFRKIKIINEGHLLGEKLKNYLKRHLALASKLSQTKTRLFYTTDQIEKFEEFGQRFFGQKISAQKIDL